MLTGTFTRATKPGSTDITRAFSSSTEISAWPGRVDMPPTSMTSAPSASIRTACSTAASGSVATPSPEKESGVTLMMPIT